jgi:hypothetical protein
MTPAPLLAVLAAPERDCGSDVNDIASCSGTLPLVGIVVVWAGLLVAFVLLPAVLLTTSVVPFLGSWFERVALGLGPETPAAPPQTAPSEVPAPGTLPPPDAPLPGVPAEPQIAPDGVPPPGVPATPGSRPGADSPAETEPSASPRPEPAVEPSPHRPPAPSPGPWPGDPETTGPNAVDEGRGDETPGSDRGDGRDLPARFDEGFEPDENEPFFDPAELTPQQNIARDLLYKLTVYGGNLTPRAEIVANFLATLAEQSGPDRVARARRLAAMAAAAVQDLPAVVERLLGQFLNNGAVVEEEIGKPGLEDKAARVMATLQALVNEHNQVKAATPGHREGGGEAGPGGEGGTEEDRRLRRHRLQPPRRRGGARRTRQGAHRSGQKDGLRKPGPRLPRGRLGHRGVVHAAFESQGTQGEMEQGGACRGRRRGNGRRRRARR